MKRNYFRLVALAMGIVAIAGTANAEWSNVTGLYLKNTSFVPGWCGSGISEIRVNCAEAFDTPFEIYQTIPEAAAGKYTLTVSAFYRYGSVEESQTDMANGANHHAYIFLNDSKKAVEGLLDKAGRPLYPNSMEEANDLFKAGEYVNTVEIDHKGGDLKFGICNPVDKLNQWTIWSNFKLVGPSGEITVANANFAEGIDNNKADDSIWDHATHDNNARTIQMNEDNGGAKGCFRLTNASTRNLAQKVTLPAGKYRLGMQSFFRHGNGNESGWYVDIKSFSHVGDVVTGYDNHKNSTELEENYPVIYVSEPVDGEYKPLESGEIATLQSEGKLYKETKIKCLFDEQLDSYPDNTPSDAPAKEGERTWNDSGFEQPAMVCFLANPDKYRNYVEFELTAPTTLWLGFKKDLNAPKYWWWAFRDLTLEREVNGSSAVAELEAVDENAPVEYYNLQGVRVVNPEKGIYIVKQGSKVTKRVIK